MKTLKCLLLATLGLAMVGSALAQNTSNPGTGSTRSGMPTVNPPAGWGPGTMHPGFSMDKLSPEIRALMEQYRNSMQTMNAEHRQLMERYRNATPAERDALRAQLRELMSTYRQNQHELAKSIRDAIKARRDQFHPKG
ncbi:MAG: hypothetical protein C0502_07830 [Opitutus sp.]|nr:hypothetical protein [Opitutus sp.]